MAPSRFSLGENKETLAISRPLPYTVMGAILPGQKPPPRPADAWIMYGTPERPQKRPRSDGKPTGFTFYSAEDPTSVLAVARPTKPSGGRKGDESYEVVDTEGQLIGRITRGRSPSRLRRAWRCEVVSTGEVFVGYRGTWVGWTLFALFLPLWIPLTIVSVIVGILEDSGVWDSLTWEFPKRTIWRVRSRSPWSPAGLIAPGSTSSSHRWYEDRLDQRLAYAQAVLNASR